MPSSSCDFVAAAERPKHLFGLETVQDDLLRNPAILKSPPKEEGAAEAEAVVLCSAAAVRMASQRAEFLRVGPRQWRRSEDHMPSRQKARRRPPG